MAKKEKGLWDTITQPFTEAVDTLEGDYVPESSRIPVNPDTYKTEESSTAQGFVPPAPEAVRAPSSTTESDPQPLPSSNGENGEEDGSLWGALKGAGSKVMGWVDDHPEGAMDLMIGATPVLMGYLTGHKEQGFTWGSKGLLQRYGEGREDAKEARTAQQKLEAAITKKKAGAAAYGKMPEFKDFKMADGSVVSHRLNRETSQYEPYKRAGTSSTDVPYLQKKQDIATGAKKDYAEFAGTNRSFQTDSAGVKWSVNNADANDRIKVFDGTGLSKRQFDDAKTSSTAYNTAVKPHREVMRKLEDSVSKMTMANTFANVSTLRGVMTEIEKRLTDKDFIGYKGEISRVAELKQQLKEDMSNEMRDRLINETLVVLDGMMSREAKMLKDARELSMSQYKARHNTLPDERIDDLFGKPLKTETSMITIEDRLGKEPSRKVPLKNLYNWHKKGWKVQRDEFVKPWGGRVSKEELLKQRGIK